MNRFALALTFISALACAGTTPAPAASCSCSRDNAIELAMAAVRIVEKQGDKDGAYSFAVDMVVTLRAVDLLTDKDVDAFRSLLSDAMVTNRKHEGTAL